jgi:hypothetical protein
MNLFELKQHQDMEFKITSIYLVNVPAECMFMADPDEYVPELWFNKKSNEKAYPHIYDEISGGEKIEYAMEYSQEHYFYCYPNATATRTRLVIETSIGGETYYYPITLTELLPNNQYSYSVVLTRLGTDSPDGSLEEDAYGVTVSIKGWTTNSSTVVI